VADGRNMPFNDNSLSLKEMKELFPDANIICERFSGLKKSLIAVKLSDER
jgi:hypothetical protein